MNFERRRFIHSLLFPSFFLLVLLVIKLVETLEGWSFAYLGVRPQSIEGLIGIITGPLIHGDWSHLYSNSVSLFVLSVSLFYFYNKIAYKVFFIIYFFSGIGIWIVARDSWHIGASGVVYGLAAFLALSGLVRNHIRLIAISFIVILFYGGMIWGAFPLKVDLPYSWEGHLWGAFIGLLLAFLYRKQGPQKPVIVFDNEDDDEGDEIPYWKQTDIEP